MAYGITDLYKGARTLRRFTVHGFEFRVVRWRNAERKHWRGYTALLHDDLCVSNDINRNCEDPYEVQMLRIFKTPEALRRSLEEMYERAESDARAAKQFAAQVSA